MYSGIVIDWHNYEKCRFIAVQFHGFSYCFMHYATNRQVAGSIPGGVEFFQWHNPSGSTMALGSTQPLTEMSTRFFFLGVKATGA